MQSEAKGSPTLVQNLATRVQRAFLLRATSETQIYFQVKTQISKTEYVDIQEDKHEET